MKTRRPVALAVAGFIFSAIGICLLIALAGCECRELPLNRAELGRLAEKAEAGNGQACWCLYLYYQYEGQTTAWGEKAANYGEPQGQYHMYLILKDTAPDKALEFLRKSAAQGHVHALTELGNLYRGGQFGGRNLDEADRYLRSAAEKGSEHAMFYLSMVLVERYESKARLTEAYKWVVIAASRSKPESGFGKSLEIEKKAITAKAAQLKYGVTSLAREAESQAARENERIPHIPFVPDYSAICLSLASKE